VLIVGGCSYLVALGVIAQVQKQNQHSSFGIQEAQLIGETPSTGDLA